MTELFSSFHWGQIFEGKENAIQSRLNLAQEQDLAASHKVTAIIDEYANVRVPLLQRHRATFPTEVSGTKTKVKVRIPFIGDPLFLSIRPMSGGTHAVIPGSVVDTSSSLANGGPAVELRAEEFSADVTPEQVKAWAKPRVDALEQELKLLRQDIDDSVKVLRQRSEAFAAQRLASLRAKRALTDGLGEGI